MLHVQNVIKDTNFYTSKLATSIPLKLIVEIDRKQIVEKLVEMILSYEDLCLEKVSKYTEFIVFDYKYIINKKLQIDECFQHNQIVHVYELLNSSGISRLFNFKNEQEAKIIKLNELALQQKQLLERTI